MNYSLINPFFISHFKLVLTGDLLYFDRYHRHQCLYPNYKCLSQYFWDHLNYCNTEIMILSG